MKKKKKPEHFVKTPGHLHGTEKVRQFLKENLKYPEEALEAKIEGVVRVQVEINDKGKVTKASIKKGLGYGCDEEALRLAKQLKFESKGHRKMRVVFHKTLNIAFNLKEYLKRNAKNKVNYSFKPSGEPTNRDIATKAAKGESTSYTYTIKINNE